MTEDQDYKNNEEEQINIDLDGGEDQKEDNDINSSQEELSILKDKYIRLVAEFDNYKKRTIKESFELRRTAAQETIVSLLPVLDDFNRAKKVSDEGKEGEVFSEGVNLVYQKIWNVMSQQGLQAMETNGEVFDPEQHEAITEIPAGNDDMKGRIIDTVESGYTLRDKIIRYAKVVVGK